MQVKISLDALKEKGFSDADIAAARGIIATRGENKGYMRASQPDFRKHGESAYIWRMLAFFLGINAMMPVMASSYIWHTELRDKAAAARKRRDYAAADAYRDQARAWEKARIKELDAVVDTLLDNIPMQQWHGVKIWGNAIYGPGCYK